MRIKEVLMKKTSLMFLTLTTAAAICLSVSPARAESVKASFTLPYAVKWGQAVLPAGPYTITVDGKGPAIVSTADGKNLALVMPVTTSRAMTDRPSALVVRSTENGRDVLFLNLREANVSYGFRLKKSEPEIATTIDQPESMATLTQK
jgi:hypothetical protein